MVTRVIQGSSEDAVKLGDKFISEGMPNSLAWGLVCSLITGTKTDATAIRTVLSQQEEDYYAKLRAKREKQGETAAAVEPKANVAAQPAATPAPAKPVAAEPATAPKATETAASTATPVAAAPTAEGEGPKDPKPTATNNVATAILVGPGDHL